MIQSTTQHDLLTQDEAIADYFDCLLNEVPDQKGAAGCTVKPEIHKKSQKQTSLACSSKYLLCSIGENLLAVPLEVEKSQCVDMLVNVTPLTGKKYIIGSMEARGRPIQIIDTASLVNSKEPVTGRQKTGENGYQYIVQLTGTNYGLAFDDVIETFTLENKDVRWRKGKVSYPWYSGISMEHNCAILDVEIIKGLVGA